MKTLNFKIEDDDLALLNYYRNTPEGGNSPQADFVKTAILEKCERTKHLRAGGLILEVPNPCNFNIGEDEKAKIIQVLKKADVELTGINPAVGSYLTELVAYLQGHFYTLTEKRRKTHSDNLLKDDIFEMLGPEPDKAEGSGHED